MAHLPQEDRETGQILRQKLDEISKSDLTNDELSDLVKQARDLRGLRFKKFNLPREQLLQLKFAKFSNGEQIVTLSKDANRAFGLRFSKPTSVGSYVFGVIEGSSADRAGIVRGDVIFSIQGMPVKMLSTDEFSSMLFVPETDEIKLLICKRPFEHTITLSKFKGNFPSFSINNGTIQSMFGITNAEANGLFATYRVFEVNGHTVAHLSDEEIIRLINDSTEESVTITIIPNMLYRKAM